MPMTVHLDIVSAETEIFSGLVQVVSITGELGELGIMPGHTPLLTKIKPGQVRTTLQSGDEEVYYVSGGMLEVQPDRVTVLADTVTRAVDLDEAAAVAAKEEAEKLLAEKKADVDYSKTLIELAQAAAQISAIRELRKRKRA